MLRRALMTRAFALVALMMLGCGARTEDLVTPPTSRAGAFVAVGEGGAVLVSDDAALRWETVASGTAQHLNAVAAGAGRIVTVGSKGTLLVSSDARRWDAIDLPVKCDLHDVAFSGGRFVTVGGDWSLGSCAYVSRDGVSWSPLGTPPTSEMAQALAEIDGTLVVSAYGRSDLMWPALFRIVTDRWEPIALGDEGRSAVFRGSTTSGGVTYVVSNEVSEVTSVVPWAQRSVSPEMGLNGWDVAAEGDALVTVGENGAALRRDGAWTRVLTTPGVLWTAVTRGPRRFVAVGQKGRVATSVEGRTWTESTSGTQDFRAVTYMPAR